MAGAAARSRITAIAIALAALVAACSDGDDPGGSRDNGNMPIGAKAGSGSPSGSAGADFGNVQQHAGQGAGGRSGAAGRAGSSSGTLDPGATECVGESQVAKSVPVDMFIMLDRSGSMTGETGTGSTKWDAMRSALSTFITDPESEGLGVGLQYFPLGAPGVPETCTMDAECGARDAICLNFFCMPRPFAVTFTPEPCSSDDQCPASSPGCARMGICELDQTAACFDLGANGCGQQGDCQTIVSECSNYSSCMVADYAAPAVPISVLPGNASALTMSLSNEKPIGATPTLPALTGAIEHVAAHAAANPDHRVLAVLATDGLPTVCVGTGVTTVDQAVQEVAGVAAEGHARTPSVETYVIGVFGPEDAPADPNGKLNSIALAGGTTEAFIVDASQDVAQQLIDALAKIRLGSLDCEFQLPKPPAGQQLDYRLVNVQVSSQGLSRDLFYVQRPEDCDKAEYGWYYDEQPEQGGTPTQIRVCEQTCTRFHELAGAAVDIKLGCATRGPD
jgi:hypothetical protein